MFKKLSHALTILSRLSFDTHLWCMSVVGGAILLCFSFFNTSVDQKVFGTNIRGEELHEGDRIIEYSSIFGNINFDAISDASELYEYIPEEVSTELEGFASVEEAIIASGVLDIEEEDESIKVVNSFSKVRNNDIVSLGLNGDGVSITEESDDFDVINEYTMEEVDVLGKLVQCEAESEDLQGKILIANVVMNRVENGQWGNSITDVIFAPGQFDPIGNGAYKLAEVDVSTKEAVLIALNGQNNSQGALYFQKSNAPWEGREYLFTYGAHSFYK